MSANVESAESEVGSTALDARPTPGADASRASDDGRGLLRELSAALDGVLYRAQHRGLALSSGLLYRAWSFLLRPGAPSLDTVHVTRA